MTAFQSDAMLFLGELIGIGVCFGARWSLLKRTLIALLVICISSTAMPQTREQRRLKRESDEVMRMLGAAHAIEDACPDYKISPQLETALVALRKPGDGAVADRIKSAKAEMRVKYGARRDPGGFCARILADHGPMSPNPVVVPKRR